MSFILVIHTEQMKVHKSNFSDYVSPCVWFETRSSYLFEIRLDTLFCWHSLNISLHQCLLWFFSGVFWKNDFNYFVAVFKNLDNNTDSEGEVVRIEPPPWPHSSAPFQTRFASLLSNLVSSFEPFSKTSLSMRLFSEPGKSGCVTGIWMCLRTPTYRKFIYIKG